MVLEVGESGHGYTGRRQEVKLARKTEATGFLTGWDHSSLGRRASSLAGHLWPRLIVSLSYHEDQNVPCNFQMPAGHSTPGGGPLA